MLFGNSHPSVTRWAPLTFGKYRRKTLPQVAWLDPGYVVWLASHYHGPDYLTMIDAERLVALMRSIRIPTGTVVEYVASPFTGFLERVDLTEPGTSRSGMRLAHLDLCVASDWARPKRDARGDGILLRSAKQILFRSGKIRMTRARAEAFFTDDSNFIASDAFAARSVVAAPSSSQALASRFSGQGPVIAPVASPTEAGSISNAIRSNSSAAPIVPLPAVPFLLPVIAPPPIPVPPPISAPPSISAPLPIPAPPMVERRSPLSLSRTDVEKLLDGELVWPDGLLGPLDLQVSDVSVLRLLFLLGPAHETELARHGMYVSGTREVHEVLLHLEAGGLITRSDGICRLSEMGRSLLLGEWDEMPVPIHPEQDPWAIMLELLVEATKQLWGVLETSGTATGSVAGSLQFYRRMLVDQLDNMPCADRALRMQWSGSRLQSRLVALFENAVIAQKAQFLRFLDDLASCLETDPRGGWDRATLSIRADDVMALLQGRGAAVGTLATLGVPTCGFRKF